MKTTTRGGGPTNADVIIVGGGLAGLTLACLLGENGVDVVCIDRDAPPDQLDLAYDGRTTAISYGSRQVLEAAGVWPSLESAGRGPCPIDTIHILDGALAGDAPPLVFDAGEVGGRSFGWIVENRDFRASLFTTAKALPNVRHVAPCAAIDFAVEDSGASVTTDQGVFSARLIVGADGRHSAVRDWMKIDTRTWSYGQQAVIACVAHDHPHDNIAVEHFRSEGPFAILPMADDADGRHRSSVVWTVHDQGRGRGSGPLHWPEPVFNAGLTSRFPARYGRVELAGPRFSYPLSLTHAHDYIGPRMALIAEAAHAVHPIAGQGLNLSLRDAAAIADLIVGAVAADQDPGADELLSAYQRQRRIDNMAMAGSTDTLNRLFSNALPGMELLRGAGLRAVSRLPMAKRFFMKQAMGVATPMPGSKPKTARF